MTRKDPGLVARLADRADARVIAAGRAGVLVEGERPDDRSDDWGEDATDGAVSAVARLTPAPGWLEEPILLGLDNGVPLFAVDLDAAALNDTDTDAGGDGPFAGAAVISLRDAGALLPRAEAGLASYVTALLNWHRRHRFCANCGHATELAEAGYVRHCPHCGANHFPRTDPVVIMTVAAGDRLLLGRRTGWPPGRLSVLAGFIGAGESAEEAVTREVYEESGIVTRDPVYATSQPWPFPASLMLGFHAVSDGGEPKPRDGELEEVHWIERDAVRGAVAGEDVGFRLPPPISIARWLVERWIAEP